MKYRRALVICAHTDDMEFGCGGTVAKMIEEETMFYIMVFSIVNPGIFPHSTLEKEFDNSMRVYGILKTQQLVYDFPMRELADYRQEILEEIVLHRDRIKPDIVFIPSLRDMHQDHQTVANEGFRAFKDCTTLGYELPWNNLDFNTTHFSELLPHHVEKKVTALGMYESQKHKKYASPDYVRALAKTRGHQVNLDLAECFEVYRWVSRV